MTKKNERQAGIWAFENDQVQNWAYWDTAFTKEECEQIIKLGESKILDVAKIGDGMTDVSSRESDIAWIYPSDDSKFIFQRVTDIIMSLNHQFFKFDLFGLAEGFQFTRYDAPAGFYGMHIDKTLGGPSRKLSITIQLSADEDYEGGKLALQTGMKPELMDTTQGKLIAFPSYILHEVQPVTKGTRYSLVAWAAGKPFK